MNVLIIGSGGREHALAYKIAESELLDKLYISPGNPGTTEIGENVIIDLGSDEIIKFCDQNKIELVVVGPEQPLVDGIADKLRKNGINVFGPNKAAAEIEGNKSFAKNLMKKYGIPTADFKVFERTDYENAVSYLKTVNYPIVIKASGLAAGKGVLICETESDAQIVLEELFINKQFGDASLTIVIEEFLEGLEASIFVVTDGDKYVVLPPSQDHKRVFDNDKGKNTGGMGAYAPAPLVDDDLMNEIIETIVEPTLDAMKTEERTYNGCLYVGLMITKEGPKVIEYNCRFGDPEAQVVLPILQGDLLKLLYSSATNDLDTNSVWTGGECAICVILASGGYPEKYEKGKIISGIEAANRIEDLVVFHAGTKLENGKLVTNGGRVLGITCIDKEGNLIACKNRVYDEVVKIQFEGVHYRKDISDKANLSV